MKVIYSYNEIYLPSLADTLGIMFEHIVDNNEDPIIFWNTFVNSNVAKQIEIGNPKHLFCSALDYLDEIYDYQKDISHEENIEKNKYYWAGWVLAYYQHKKGYSFHKINEYLPIEKVLSLYNPLHEADITKFFDVADTYFNHDKSSNLKKIREAAGLSQSKLAELADVKLRSIQMYEQKKNDINKAQGITLFKLSRVLCCSIEDLLEY